MERRSEQDHAGRRSQAAPAHRRRALRPEHPGAVQRLHQGRDRQVGAGRQGVRSPRRLKAAQRDHLLLTLEQRLASGRLPALEAAALLADDFVEFGASGKVWTKQEILAAMENGRAIERTFVNFTVREVGPSTCFVTYQLIDADGRSSLRSSLWRRVDEDWQMLFHQGTLTK